VIEGCEDLVHFAARAAVLMLLPERIPTSKKAPAGGAALLFVVPKAGATVSRFGLTRGPAARGGPGPAEVSRAPIDPWLSRKHSYESPSAAGGSPKRPHGARGEGRVALLQMEGVDERRSQTRPCPLA